MCCGCTRSSRLSPRRRRLAVGLKVDVEALPRGIIAALKRGQVDLTDPGRDRRIAAAERRRRRRREGQRRGQLTSIGITCALCHSTVDDSFAPGIGRRLDGWANTDLNVGAIVALSPALDAATKAEFNAWGPGKYDPRHHAFDGTNLIPLNSPSLPIVIPPIYGLKGVGFETFTGDGPIWYWNSYVGVGQMGGQGTFSDPRIGLFISADAGPGHAEAAGAARLSAEPATPEPPKGSFDRAAAQRGRRLFRNEARMRDLPPVAELHRRAERPRRSVPFLHDPAEVGTDPRYAARTATGKYRTTPLRGLWQHPPYFHDGSAPDLPAVVNHYNQQFGLNLTEAQKADLVEFLKSL